MRLIVPVVLTLIGGVTGALVQALLGRRRQPHHLGLRIGSLAGMLGAFVGLFMRDALDIEFGGLLFGALLAALLGAAATAAVAVLVTTRSSE